MSDFAGAPPVSGGSGRVVSAPSNFQGPYMKVEIEEIDPCNRQLKIEIPFQTYQDEVQAYYRKLGRQVSLPGFRKGKVPVAMLEKKFGPEVKREVLTQLVSDSITQAIQEHNLKALGEPRTLNIEAEEGTDITVTANVEVVPEFEIQDPAEIELTLKIPRVTDKEIDQVIEVYRERNAESRPVTDRGVQTGDLITIDFEGLLEGQPFEGGQARDYKVQMGSKSLIDGFDEQLMGMRVGEVRDFRLKLPEVHPNRKLAGKEVDFRVTLKGIEEKILPEVNDEFARKADPEKNYQTVAELRDGIRKGLEDFERAQAKKEARQELAAQLGARHPITVPERLVREQIEFMVKKERRKAAGEAGEEESPPAPEEEPVPITPADEKKFRETAVKLLQQELVIGKLAEEWGIEVTEEDLNKEIQTFLSLTGGGDREALKKQWAQSGALLRLHTRLRREKTLDALMEKVRIREEMVDRPAPKADNEKL